MAEDWQKQKHKVITSFILRFITEEEASPTGNTADFFVSKSESSVNNSEWRGLIQHIQSGAEGHFTSFAEVQAFIQKFIEN
jgi:hypothetical protein